MTATTAPKAPKQLRISEAGRLASLRCGDWLGLLVGARKRHQCCLCGQQIEADEGRVRWSGLVHGEGYCTSHAHPECMEVTRKWDEDDWECTSPGDITRPNTKMSHGSAANT